MNRQTPLRWLKAVARIAVVSYVGVAVLLFLLQRHYIYYPHRAEESELTRIARVDGLEPWRDPEGRLIGWHTASRPEAERVLVFHGNAGYAVDRSYYAHAFAARPAGRSWQVFLLEYPGYGAREGTPGENALMQAARQALKEMRADNGPPPFVLGESLGSGVGAILAGEHPEAIAGLLLITPFPSLADVAAAHYPILPVRLLLRDRFDAAAALRSYAGPVVVLVAGRDRVVPARLGRRLYEGYDGPKRLIEQTDRDHNTLNVNPGADWWDEAFRFLLAP